MRIFCLLLLVSACFACSNDPVKKQLYNFSKRTPHGSVISNVICKLDLQESYAVYLPSKYNPENKYPVLFCFDPHGDGVLPLNLLKDEAEKLGMVLVGSNNIRNGLSQDEITQMIGVLMKDVFTNVNVDDQRIYTVGFSGGARVALSALFINSKIRGVIACSGSIPASYIPSHVYIAGIGGTYDMNYAEMTEMEKGFAPDAKKHILLTFPGKHSWPPKATINAAMEWLAIGEMKDKFIPVDNKIIDRFTSYLNNDTLGILQKYRGCQQIIQTLDGLTDVSMYQEKLNNMESDPGLQNEMVKEIHAGSIEKTKQKTYQEAFNIKPVSWWKEEVLSLNKAINESKDKMDIALNKRLLAYISLYAYSASNYAKKAGDKNALAGYVEIYGLADPQNPDYFYFLAYTKALTGNKEHAANAIKSAIKNGFTDKQKIAGDSVFSAIFDSQELQNLLNPK